MSEVHQWLAQPPQPSGALLVHPLPGIPEISAGEDLGATILRALDRAGLKLMDGDVLAVSSKVISKAQGLRDPGPDRVAAVLRESRRIVAERRTPTGTTRIVEALAGPIMAGAGIDGSNTGPTEDLLLLPHDPDLAARELYADLLRAAAPAALPRIGIVVTDTAGRPWRAGQTDFALGSCAVAVEEDLRGGTDADGRPLAVTSRAVADEIAAAADLVKGKASAVPVALVRGLPPGTVTDPGAQGARSLVRTGPGDWFALGAAEALRSALGVPPGSAAAETVGVATVTPEEYADRLARATRLALHGQGPATVDPGTGRHPTGDAHEDTGHEHTGQVLVVSAQDPEVAGRVAARLEVALASESLTGLTVLVSSRP